MVLLPRRGGAPHTCTDPEDSGVNPNSTLISAYVGWTLLFAGFTWLRYRRVSVDR